MDPPVWLWERVLDAMPVCDGPVVRLVCRAAHVAWTAHLRHAAVLMRRKAIANAADSAAERDRESDELGPPSDEWRGNKAWVSVIASEWLAPGFTRETARRAFARELTLGYSHQPAERTPSVMYISVDCTTVDECTRFVTLLRRWATDLCGDVTSLFICAYGSETVLTDALMAAIPVSPVRLCISYCHGITDAALQRFDRCVRIKVHASPGVLGTCGPELLLRGALRTLIMRERVWTPSGSLVLLPAMLHATGGSGREGSGRGGTLPLLLCAVGSGALRLWITGLDETRKNGWTDSRANTASAIAAHLSSQTAHYG
jgi:hypothetical protein